MRQVPSAVDVAFDSLFRQQLPTGFDSFRSRSDHFQKTGISLGLTEATLLQFLVRLNASCSGAQAKWIEIGTLTGFSAFCIASSLPENSIVYTFEKNSEYAQSAKSEFANHQKKFSVEVIEGDAAFELEKIVHFGPFDGIFIDGNKGGYCGYLDWSKKNLKSGALIIADNIFLGGAIFDNNETGPWSPSVISKMKRFLDDIFNPEIFYSALIPTDEGLVVAIKK